MWGDDKHLGEYNKEVYCWECEHKKLTHGPVEVFKDTAGHVLGFKCPDCKALWRIEEMK